MAEQPAISFDSFIKEARNKRKHEELANRILGKDRRSSAPPREPKASLGGNLASRVGVNKRTSSLPRTTVPRQPRPSAGRLANHLARPKPAHTQSTTDLGSIAVRKYNGPVLNDATDEDGGEDLVIRGVARGPFTVVAQNFAPGTTAADIESVMASVGGEMTSCKLVAATPTVIAEMAFVERSGGEKVIETFNGKKADGRPLYVFWKAGGAPPKPSPRQPAPATPAPVVEPPAPQPVDDRDGDVVMDVDENAEAREAENRRREEHRGRDDRPPRDAFPTGPTGPPRGPPRPYNDGYGYPAGRRDDWGYNDGRQGFGGGYRDARRGGGGGRYPRDDRRQWGGGQSWRP